MSISWLRRKKFGRLPAQKIHCVINKTRKFPNIQRFFGQVVPRLINHFALTKFQVRIHVMFRLCSFLIMTGPLAVKLPRSKMVLHIAWMA